MKPLLLLLISVLPFSALTASRDVQWKKVDDAINNGLPKTAITELEPIIRDALNDKAYGFDLFFGNRFLHWYGGLW